MGGLARQTVARNVTINNLLPGIFDGDAQRRHIEGMPALDGKSFDEIWQARAMANPAKRLAGRPNSGRIAHFFARNMPARYRAEHFDRWGKLSRDV